MLKKTIGIIIGLIVGLLSIATIEALSHFIYPSPKNFDFNNKLLLKEHIKNLPIFALLFVILAHGVGTFLGSLIANRISQSIGIIGLIVSTIFLTLTIVNLFLVPFHPIWFAITDIIFTFSSGWIAFKIALKKKK